MPTLERLTQPVRLPFFRVDVQAAMAGLTGVGRRNQHHRHSSNRSFVTHKDTQLVERPVIGSTALSLAARFLIQTFSDTRQVLKSQGSTNSFGIPDQCLADGVVQPCLVAPFSPREPSQQLPRAASAFGLNISTYTTEPISDSLDVLATPRASMTGSGDIPPTQIHPNDSGSLACEGSIQLNRNVDVVLALPGLGQSCTGGSLPPQQCDLVAANLELEPNPSPHQGHAHNLVGFSVLKSTRIQTQASGAKPVDLFHRLGIADYPANRLTDVISLQTCSGPHWLINPVMQLGGVPAFFTFGGIENLVTSVSESLQSAVNVLTQLYRDYQLATYRDGLAHAVTLTHPDFDQYTYKEAGFPPDTDMVRVSSPKTR